MPAIAFPEALPITAFREPIQQALRDHQVIIVCGDTGSGKTTQLPKMALQLGRAAEGRLIGCTQPRRLAAVTVARRVAEEFGEPVGGLVGYQHRFERRLGRASRIKFMTDGILLAETRASPLLEAYDTLIIDEAHERSLNIDFLLGLVKRILPRRPGLRVVVSSATLDAGRFSDFFGGAPTLSIPGRLHPIEIRYREPGDDDPDLPRLIAQSVEELVSAGPGDILVFLPGERDIREAAAALTGRRLPGTTIIPLMASLPVAEQQRAFQPADGRRVILSTNVAETSVTLPGIRYVIDSGLARISRYVHRTQVQRLQIEAVSQASARQRAGRCGRVGPGICIRLYDEADYQRRDPYTDPEILRSSLAGVILTMLDLGLGDITQFPFLDPPAPAMIREGLRELDELGAVRLAPDGGMPKLSTVGWQLAKMPVEPRLARMLLAGHREEALRDALTVVASLACDDPRRRPIEQQAEADRAHAAWQTPASDFAALLKLWRWWDDATRGASQQVARRLCREHFLSFAKMREWRDLRDQIEKLCRRLGLAVESDRGGDDGLHRALLTGLLGRIGHRDPEAGDYRGARGLRFSVFPGSGLFKRQPEWLMAGELVDTSRLYAREAASIDPRWIEGLAGDRCKRSYHSPAWDAEHGFVRATERVTLFGLVIVEGRRCDYTRIEPAVCRDLFIRHGLVAGDFPRPPPLVRENQELLAAIRLREEKRRRQGQLLDEERLVAFFDGRLPPDINSADALRTWLRRAPRAETETLRLKPDEWMVDDDATAGFPDTLRIGESRLPLAYRHAYGEEDDGITCTVTREEAPLLRRWPADWLVPGALPEKVQWMLGRLAVSQRRVLGPMDEAVSRCLGRLRPGREPLTMALAGLLQETFGVRVADGLWPEEQMPPHLRVRFVVVDEKGTTLAAGRDLEAVLREAGVVEMAAAPAAGTEPWRQDGLVGWTCGSLPEQVDVGRAGWPLVNYPALQDQGASVSLRLFAEPVQARTVHHDGVRRLLLLALGSEARRLARLPAWPVQAGFFLRQIGYAPEQVADDLALALVADVFLDGQSDVRTPEAFAARLEQGRVQLAAAHREWQTLVTGIIALATERHAALNQFNGSPAAVADMQEQLAWLVFPGFVRYVPRARLQHYFRYFEAQRLRLERLAVNAAADARKMAEVAPFWARYLDLATADPPRRHDRLALDEYRWMVEAFRISCFAQELKAPCPVSAKRLEAQWAKA
jgi:ATP-dependent helicase HrpA